MEIRQGECPKCGSDELEYGEFGYGNIGDTGYYLFVCKKCGCVGKEWYEMMYTESEITKEAKNEKGKMG